jgi:hypothetical protein
MKKIISVLLFYCISGGLSAQTKQKVSSYLFAQYTNTIYDQTLGNNPWGAGLGIQFFLNNKTKFKPLIELTGDIYLQDDQLARIDGNGKLVDDVPGMVNLFIGSACHLNNTVYVSFLAGPSFINSKTLLGIKPSAGCYLSKNKRWTAKISYINIFNRNKPNKEDFGSISFALGVKLF